LSIWSERNRGFPVKIFLKRWELLELNSARIRLICDVKNQIYNQGKNGRSFLWYPVTAETEDQIPFIHEARAILKDLQQTPVAHRERRLAKLLSEREASREKHIL
jgi:hypothetical protein